MNNRPRRPELPEAAPQPPPNKPNPLHKPDERKEGGPDFGKVRKQQEHHRKTEDDARHEAEE